MLLVGVFELVHQSPDDAAAPIDRDRRFEMQRAMGAIRANEGICDRAAERLRTRRAKRCANPGGFLAAGLAQIRIGLYIGGADRAAGRIEK